LQALGVDTDESKLLKLSMSMIDDVAKTISTFMKDYKAMDEEERPKVLFIIDSLGMMMTPTDVNQFESGDMKGDMGRKPKALASLVRNTVNMIGSYNVGMIATNHTYASQDMFDPDDKISGGQGFIYASSIVVAMRKLKLKEDADGNKTSTVNGIRAACKVMKTRYSKPFESVQVKIPYETGMDPYSGHLDIDGCFVHIEKYGNETVETVTNFSIPKTICATPWINLEIRQQGHLTPCCVYKVDNYKNVKNVSVKDIDYTDLRQQLLDGERPTGCNYCWNNEKNNVKSQRLNDAYVYRDKIFDIDYNDTKTNKLVSLDIKINKTCNLSCRICTAL
jgi:RecA/RadA recombinase